MNRREAVKEIYSCREMVNDFIWHCCNRPTEALSAQSFVDLGKLQQKLDSVVECFKRDA